MEEARMAAAEPTRGTVETGGQKLKLQDLAGYWMDFGSALEIGSYC